MQQVQSVSNIRGVEGDVGFHTSLDTPHQFPELWFVIHQISCTWVQYPMENDFSLSYLPSKASPYRVPTQFTVIMVANSQNNFVPRTHLAAPVGFMHSA